MVVLGPAILGRSELIHRKSNVLSWETMQTQYRLLFCRGALASQKGIQQTQGVVNIEGVLPTIGPGPGP